MPYNIRYWWFFFSQGNRWTKYLVYPKIRNRKPFLLKFASLVALDGFHLLLSWQPIWLRSEVVDPCFIHCHIFTQKNFLLRWNSCKIRSESSTRCCFWSTVSKRNTRFQHSFLIDKRSCKKVNTLPFSIFESSAISRNFNLRSTKRVCGVF